MSFNFPDNPTPGQIFEPTAGVVYIWQSPAWKRYVPPLEEGEAGIEEAPIDGQQYTRIDAAWQVMDTEVDEAPTDGEQYVRKDAGWEQVSVDVNEAPIDDLTYGRKNAAWATVVGGAVISDGPPPGPLQAGQLWYEGDTGNTYIWYADGDSSQWVQVNIQPAAVPSVPPGLTANARNRLVNPAFQISQENAKNTSITANGAFLSDQWYMSFVTGGTQYGASYPPTSASGDPDVVGWMRLGCSTADAAVAAGDYFRVAQWIEGTRVYDFKWGSSAAKPVVLRFKARSSIIGTFTVNVRSNNDSTFAKNCTFTQINVWQDFVITIPPLTTGTFVVDTAASVMVQFAVMCGTTNLASATDAWVSGPGTIGAPGISNWMSVAGQTFDVANVGLYLDPLATGVAPRFEMPDEAAEMIACRRYYQYNTWVAGGFWLHAIDTGSIWRRSYHGFTPEMRIVPAITITTGGNALAGGMPAATSLTTYSAELQGDLTGSGYTYVTSLKVNARM